MLTTFAVASLLAATTPMALADEGSASPPSAKAQPLGIADAQVEGVDGAIALQTPQDAERQVSFGVAVRRYLDRSRITGLLMFFGLLGLVVALRRDPRFALRAAGTLAAMVVAFTLAHLRFRTPAGYLIDLTGLGLYAMVVIVALVGVYLVVWGSPSGAWLRRVVRGRKE